MELEMNAAAGGETDADVEYNFGVHGLRSSLLDVLMPATPPEPKNARIVRLFDIEGATNDPQPNAAVAEPVRREARSGRRASRELRSQSLLAAAGLM